MKPVIDVLKTPSGEESLYWFWCPGCKEGHGYTKGRWEFNGDLVKPTFSPSLLCNGHDSKKRCHLYLRNGQIQFLSDCHHELAGQTVPAIPIEELFNEEPQDC